MAAHELVPVAAFLQVVPRRCCCADEYVAQVKFTACLLPSGNVARLTNGPATPAKSDCTLEDEELVALLAQTTDKKKKKKQNKKKKEGGGEDPAE